MIAPANLAARHGLRRVRAGEWRGACPSCGYQAGFVLTERAGRLLWWCASCGSGPQLTRAVRGDSDPPPMRERQQKPARCRDWRETPARRLWRAARPIAGTPAAAYLAARGLDPGALDAVDLRFVLRCPHPSGAELPALVAQVRNAVTREPQALHRTFLSPDGSSKADVDPPRASLGPLAGGVVMLGARAADQPHQPLLLGEGIETTASAAALIGGTPWAAISAGNLARLNLPPEFRDLIIAADHDPVGEAAAWAAATRWRSEGRTVRVAFPDRPGTDFNDQVSAHDA